MTSPVITVATVVYNGAREIARTIDSVLSQDYTNLEYVVIDGDSLDGTKAIVAGYGDRIDVFLSEPDQGIYDGMNKAVIHAKGEFILFMNCGDVFATPDALKRLALAVQADGVEELVFGGWIRREAWGRETRHWPNLRAGLFNHQSILYSRSLHARFGGYANVPGLTTADYLFFTLMTTGGAVPWKVIDEVVAVIDTGGISAGPQTLSQKYAIDYLCGRTDRLKLTAVLLLHPLYNRIKSMLKGLR